MGGWQYNGPGVTPKDTTRFLIGDTLPQCPLLSDTEIEWVLGLYNNAPMNAAIRCAEILIAHFSRQADETIGPVKVSFSQKAESFRKLVNDLRNRLATEDSTWFAGGVNKAQTQANWNNCAIIKPDFYKHMMENSLISPWISGPVNEYPGWGSSWWSGGY